MTLSMFKKLYIELKEKYKCPQGQWKLWCKRPKTKKEREEVIIGAVLTQRTNWKNVEIAINNLKKAGIISLKGIYKLGVKKLTPLIKPSGFYRVKARYLFSLAKFIIENYGTLGKMRKEELEELRKKLLKTKGIGPETADSVLLYGLDKPVFVIDEYTRRLIKKRKLFLNLSYPSEAKGGVKEDFFFSTFAFATRKLADERIFFDYEFLRELFEENLKRDFRLFQDFHAFIVIDGKNK